jgi:hypothetical protein
VGYDEMVIRHDQEVQAVSSSTNVSPRDDSSAANENARVSPAGHRSRLNQALAWVGIVAGGLFIVSAIFFSGFFLSRISDGHWREHPAPGPMACCSEMKPGDQMHPDAMMGPGGQMTPGEMKPGETKPGGMMGPGGPIGPAPQSPTPSSPRP